MSKAIRSYPKSEQVAVIRRRLNNQVQGLGYFAARDAEYHINANQARENNLVTKKED